MLRTPALSGRLLPATALRVRRPGAAVAGAAGVGAAATGFLLSLPARPYPWSVWLPMQAVGLSFTVAGVWAWLHRPANGTGRLMTAVGITWYIGDLQTSAQPVLYAVGFCLFFLVTAVFTHLVLALPSGRLATMAERVVVAGLYASVTGSQVLRYLTEHPAAPQVWGEPTNLSIWAPVGTALGGSLTLVAFWLVLRRWWAAGRPARRALAVLWSTGVLVGVIALVTMLTSALRASPDLLARLLLAFALALICAPFAILTGLLRVRLARIRVADLVMRLEAASEPAQVRDAVAEAVNDPTLEVCFRLPGDEGYVDADGQPAAIPTGGDRAVTFVDRQGEQLAALIHDPALLDQRPLVDAVVAAAGLALQNARLHAAHRAQLQEALASRARIVAAADAERHRIQRDLHDGAQADLLAISMQIGQARVELADGGEPSYLSTLLAKAGGQLHDVIRRLRELAEGIDPPALTEQGLPAAVERLAERAPLPVLFDIPPRRWPGPVERTAYFVINEALANVYKHAHATRATVAVQADDGTLLVQVSDDGIGGADPARGAGLRGLRDRVAAIGGTLHIHTRPDRGTLVEAELPCG